MAEQAVIDLAQHAVPLARGCRALQMTGEICTIVMRDEFLDQHWLMAAPAFQLLSSRASSTTGAPR